MCRGTSSKISSCLLRIPSMLLFLLLRVCEASQRIRLETPCRGAHWYPLHITAWRQANWPQSIVSGLSAGVLQQTDRQAFLNLKWLSGFSEEPSQVYIPPHDWPTRSKLSLISRCFSKFSSSSIKRSGVQNSFGAFGRWVEAPFPIWS